MKKIGEAKAPCTVYFEWSPCSRFYLTAILTPRLRVDNSLLVWTYDGKLVREEKFGELYQAGWRPAGEGVYPDRPMSPKRKKKEEEGGVVGVSGGIGRGR